MIQGQEKYFRCFLSVAIALATLGLPFIAYAQQDPRPEIEIDGSVLQTLSQYPSASGLQRNLAPVQLRPPVESDPTEFESLNSISPAAGESRTIAVQEDIEEKKEKISIKPPAEKPLVKKKVAARIESAPLPGRKPGSISTPVTETAREIEPSPVIQSLRDEPKQDIQKILEQSKVKPTPEILGSSPQPAPKTQSRPVLKPPVILKAPDDKPVSFSITEKQRTGGLNPSNEKTDLAAPDIPVKTIAAIDPALEANTPAQPLTPLVEKTEPVNGAATPQQNPAVLYKDVPLPKRRPAIQTASQEFVREARKTYLETYTIKRREGDVMPAVPKEKVKTEELPPKRLSVADIENDPLASRIVDMTPEEVAATLSQMAPASGRAASHMSRELNAASKPRIIRQEGEWIRKSKTQESAQVEKENLAIAEKPAQPEPAKAVMPIAPVVPESKPTPPTPEKTEVASIAPPVSPAEAAPLKPAAQKTPDILEISFNSGKSDLDEKSSSLVDEAIVSSLKKDPASRVQIVAWASSTDGKEGTARRLSLSRALAVRSFLIAKGIDATRMDVRAMGIQQDSKSSPDKVDLMLISPEKT